MKSKIYYWLEQHGHKQEINGLCDEIQKNIVHLNILCATGKNKDSLAESFKWIETQKEFVKGMAYVYGVELPSSYYTPLLHLTEMED